MKPLSDEEEREFHSALAKLQAAFEQLRNGLESEETPMRNVAVWNIVILGGILLGIIVWVVVR